MKGKSTKSILKICEENEGKVLPTKEILKLFGYSTKCNIERLKIRRFLSHDKYEYPTSYWEIHSWVLITRDQFKSLREDIPLWQLSMHGIRLYDKFLYPKSTVPWWMLKEYGGTI